MPFVTGGKLPLFFLFQFITRGGSPTIAATTNNKATMKKITAALASSALVIGASAQIVYTGAEYHTQINYLVKDDGGNTIAQGPEIMDHSVAEDWAGGVIYPTVPFSNVGGKVEAGLAVTLTSTAITIEGGAKDSLAGLNGWTAGGDATTTVSLDFTLTHGGMLETTFMADSTKGEHRKTLTLLTGDESETLYFMDTDRFNGGGDLRLMAPGDYRLLFTRFSNEGSSSAGVFLNLTVPEPETYGACAALALTGFWVIRRRSVKA